VLIVNDTVFAHGGLLPRHVEFGLERLNSSVADWMRGKEITDEKASSCENCSPHLRHRHRHPTHVI
jgi:hypothetical protein